MGAEPGLSIGGTTGSARRNVLRAVGPHVSADSAASFIP